MLQVEKKHSRKCLRPPIAMAFQIGGIGEGDPLLSICRVRAIFNESVDELLAWKERHRGKMGGAKRERCEWAVWE